MVLATADSVSKVAAAIFARPHVMADGVLAFFMRVVRLTHKNLQENPYAAYLFIEAERGYKALNLIGSESPQIALP